jgi:hypothetical protein
MSIFRLHKLKQLEVKDFLNHGTSNQRGNSPVRKSINIPVVKKYQNEVPQTTQEKPGLLQRFKDTVTQPKVEIPPVRVDTFLYKRLKDNGLDDNSIADKLGVSESMLPNRQKTAPAKFLDEQLGKVFKFQPGETLPRLDLPEKKGTYKTILGKEVSKDSNRKQIEALVNTPINIIDDVVKSLSKTENVLGDKDARTSEKVATYLEVPLNSARMIPGWAKFETLLNIASENPITENIADAVNTGFEYLGKAGSPIGAKFISVLPISDEAKEDLTPIAENIGGFTTQFLTLIALHKGISKGKDIKIKTGADTVLEWKDIRDITVGKTVEPKKLDAYKKLTDEGISFTDALKEGKGKIKVGGKTETVGEYVMRKAKDIKNKAGLSIEDVSLKKKEDPLIQEAKKYKSAEEFVATKKAREIADFEDLPSEVKTDIASDIFEQTRPTTDFAAGINASDIESGLAGIEITKGVEDVKFLLEQFSIQKRGVSSKAVDNLKKLIQDGVELDPIIVNGRELIDGGHRLVAFDELGMKEIPVVDVQNIFKELKATPETILDPLEYGLKSFEKTKSQLTDIFNKANKATPETALLQEAKKYKSAEELQKIKFSEIKDVNVFSDKIDKLIKEASKKELGKIEKLGEDLMMSSQNYLENGAFTKTSAFNDFKLAQSIRYRMGKLRDEKMVVEKANRLLAQKEKDLALRKADSSIDVLTDSDTKFLTEQAKNTSLDEFLGLMRGSATQYGKYNPKLRRFLNTDSVRLSEVDGFKPNDYIDVYRGIDGRARSINSGDFVTMNFDDAASYTSDASKVVSKRVKAKDLVTEYPDEIVPGEEIYELIFYPSSKKFVKITDTQLTDIWKKAQEKPLPKPTPQAPKQPSKPVVVEKGTKPSVNIKPSDFIKAERIKKTKQIKEIKEPINKVALTDSEVDVVQSYEVLKDRWLGKKDVDVLKAQVEKNSLQSDIKKALGKKKYDQEAKDADSAIQIYLDTKRNPEDYANFYSKLTPEQQRIADLSQNLDPKLQKIADKIDESYREVGLEAMDSDIIKNVLDNYVARVWDIENKPPTESFRKFGQTTRHAKARTFGTILEGQAAGMDLKVQGATGNLEILKTEIKNTIADKKFIRSLNELKTVEGQPFLTDKQLDGYIPIEHPSFTSWKFAGNAVEGEVYGKNFFVTPDGILMERRKLFAPKEQAKNLNNILGASKLKGLPGIDTLTKYNAIAKSWILQSSFFHHLAFTRSYFLGTNHKQFKEMNLNQAYKTGLQSIKNLEPDIVLGVENGLTLGLKQDWEESLLQEKTIIGEVLDKTKATKAVKDKIIKLRQAQADFLFGEFGSGLKAKAFLIEYRNLLKKDPNMPTKKAATMAANLINDDFGGLHLKRLGRNPTVQHVFRIFALAPDWTESNIRSMVKAVGAGDKAERAFYRKFWAGIMTKGVILTVLANLLMVGGDIDDLEENYKTAWNAGKFRWLDVDVTNIYRLLGGESQEHKYFSILGHFKDVIKFASHPIRSAQHKGSVVYRIFHEALTGTNYAGQKFTTYKELLEDKKTVKFGSSSPIEFGQVPSYLISQVKGTQPVQVQNLINWMLGEMEGFDAIGNSLGLGVATTYSASETPKKQKEAFHKELKKQLEEGIITKDIAEAEMAKEITKINKATVKDFKANIGSLSKDETHTRLKELISEGVIDQAGAEEIMASKIKAVDAAEKETQSAEKAREDGVLKKTEEESIFRTIERGANALGVDFPTAVKAIFTKEKIDVVTKQRVGLERLEKEVTEAFEREHVVAKDKKKYSVEHWVPRSIGGKNYPDSGNLRIIPTALHDEFTPLENEILKAVENNTMSPSRARRIIKDYKDKRFKEYEEDKQIKEAPSLDSLL